MSEANLRILGIETSCDETSVAVVENGRVVLSNVISSQIELHKRFGGVVPEMASRQHILYIVPAIQEALQGSGLDWDGIDAVTVANGPGLAGALLVGVNAGKAIAYALGKPLVSVNHLEAHIYANWLRQGMYAPAGETPPDPQFPLLCLVVSGGHTELILMKDHGVYALLGRTRDDAAGEAFDKVARILGLGYPGGPVIERTAGQSQNPIEQPRAWLKGSYDFSFSGLKTAVLRTVARTAGESITEAMPGAGQRPMQIREVVSLPQSVPVADIAAGFQESVVDVLVTKTAKAAQRYSVKEVLIAGGVAANSMLRAEMVRRIPKPVYFPPKILCTDNAAMVASAAYFRYLQGCRAELDLDVYPNAALV
jgi:N6-L-threonylcarbamoyladenine synthase